MLRLGKEDGDRVHHFAKRLNRLVSNLHDLQKGWALRQFGALEHLLEEKKPSIRVHSKLICNEGLSIDFLS